MKVNARREELSKAVCRGLKKAGMIYESNTRAVCSGVGLLQVFTQVTTKEEVIMGETCIAKGKVVPGIFWSQAIQRRATRVSRKYFEAAGSVCLFSPTSERTGQHAI